MTSSFYKLWVEPILILLMIFGVPALLTYCAGTFMNYPITTLVMYIVMVFGMVSFFKALE